MLVRIRLRILSPHLKTRFGEVTTQIRCAVGVHFYEWLKHNGVPFTSLSVWWVPLTFDFVLAPGSSSWKSSCYSKMWPPSFSCFSSSSGLLLTPPWKAHHPFCFWLCVCLAMVNAFFLPGSSVPPRTVRTRLPLLCLPCSGCITLSVLHPVPASHEHTLLHVLNPSLCLYLLPLLFLLILSLGKDVFFRKPGIWGEEDFTFGLFT